MKPHLSDWDTHWMHQALLLAEQSQEAGEIPVGAVLVRDQICLGTGHNQSIRLTDPTAHAEIMALRAGAQREQNHRLLNTTLYVTLEPCMMCFSAMLHARVERCVFAAADTEKGIFSTQQAQQHMAQSNHLMLWDGGCCAAQSMALLTQFFEAKRTG